MIYEISEIGFQDKFKINFYKVYTEETDLKSILASLLFRLLLLKFKYNYFIEHFDMEIERFGIIFYRKLLVYYRYKI